MKEVWKKHWSGLLVSNKGLVFVPKSGKHKEHYTYGSKLNEYLYVNYNKKRYVHDLVYETFHNIKLNGLHVHHKNGDTKDNRLENLISLSKKEHDKLHGKERSKQVLQYDLNGNFIHEWYSTMEIQRQLGYFSSSIVNCCNNKPGYKTYKGYIWRYKTE